MQVKRDQDPLKLLLCQSVSLALLSSIVVVLWFGLQNHPTSPLMCKTSKMALKFARFVILRPFVPSLSTSRSITSTRLACDAKKDVAEAIDPTPIRQRVHRRDLRFMFPEFLPDPEPSMRNKLVEKMQRKDMLKRRQVRLAT